MSHKEQLQQLKNAKKALTDYNSDPLLVEKVQEAIDKIQPLVQAEHEETSEERAAFQAKILEMAEHADQFKLSEETKDKLLETLIERQVDNWQEGCMDRDEMYHIAENGFTGYRSYSDSDLIKEYVDSLDCDEDMTQDDLINAILKDKIQGDIENKIAE